MSVDVEASSLQRTSNSVVARVLVRPIRHVRQAAGRYVQYALLLRKT